jgi:hypothetical protein
MRLWSTSPRLRALAGLAVVAAAASLEACAAPPYRYVASTGDDVVIKVPRSWTVVRDGAPQADATSAPEPDGAWQAVYDADAKPDPNHANPLVPAKAPVALARTYVLTKEQGQSLSADTLRDAFLPVTEAARARFVGSKEIETFRLLRNEDVKSRTATGVHVVYSYDLGRGRAVFDEIVMLSRQKTRVHLLVVHCLQSCYTENERDIAQAVDSFTVKVP